MKIFPEFDNFGTAAYINTIRILDACLEDLRIFNLILIFW